MKTAFDDLQYDNLLLDDGEVLPNVLKQFPAAKTAYQEHRIRQTISHVAPRVIFSPCFVMLVLYAIFVGMTVSCHTLLGAPDSTQPRRCLVIQNTITNIYLNPQGNYVIGLTQQDEAYKVLVVGNDRYQIEEGWIDKSTVQVEEQTCRIDNY